MKKFSIIIGIVGSLLLLATFLFPIWSISLEAPQYPGGINMYIWINKISGDTPHTLQNVNILNHYIGMKAIEPESIPELTYFPYIIVFMTLFGIAAAISMKKKIVMTWMITLVIIGIAGMVDFYMWEYDYGHDLNPNAPIKVPGQTYQPPLIGSQYLLNFKATSLPHVGSYFIGAGFLFMGATYFMLKKVNKPKNDKLEDKK
jgi:copper chaperone NosL